MKRRVEDCKHEFRRVDHETVCVNCGLVTRKKYRSRPDALQRFTVRNDVERIKYRNIKDPSGGKKIIKSGAEIAARAIIIFYLVSRVLNIE